MKQFYLPLIAGAALLLSSCSGDRPSFHTSEKTQGGLYRGGVIRMNEVESFKSLYPLAINDIVSFHIATQVYDGLVKFNQNDLSISPALAYRWEVNPSQTLWTFHLRQEIRFHDDPCFPGSEGREFSAEDVKYCFDRLCRANRDNSQFDVTFRDRVAGANETYAASLKGENIGVSGVKVMDDSTISISLRHPCAGFLNILAMPGCFIFAKEAVEKYGSDIRLHPVGTGAFIPEIIREGDVVLMKRNPEYYLSDRFGNALPYLDGIKYNFIPEKKAEILEFKRGNLDMVYGLPVEVFHDIMGELEHAKDRKTDFEIISSPSFNTNFIGFNCSSPAFNKKEVRLAFNYAIDRHKIANFTIQGEGRAAEYGMVPYIPRFEKEGYNYKQLKGYHFDVAKARQLLAEAGYPDGKGFPKVTLQINSGGEDRNILVAEVVQHMLKENLHVDVDIEKVPWAEHIEQVQSGKVDIFRFSWYADYPDPETFLALFYGDNVPENPGDKAFINFFRFRNAQLDSLFKQAMTEPELKKRFALLSQAENVMLENAPCIPVFYDENYRLEQRNVRNFPENPMNYMDLSQVYLLPTEARLAAK